MISLIKRDVVMAVSLIKGKFYVTSKSSKQIYEVGPDLQCGCKGFPQGGRCRHIDEIKEYLQSGEVVNPAKTSVFKELERERGWTGFCCNW